MSRFRRSVAAWTVVLAAVLLVGVMDPALGQRRTGVVAGELRKWHRVTITFDGPDADESATPNPFTDYRLAVTFTHAAGGRKVVVPGFYAADGRAAETGATRGRKWRVHFAPDAEGRWTYVASFRTGRNRALDARADAGKPAAFDGASGALTVGPSGKKPPDFRAKGFLRHAGGHYLRFAETGQRFLKAGADSPENLLGCADFDGTFDTRKNNQKDPRGFLHRYAPHVRDFRPGDPTWRGGKGKGLIGALNYLASEGMNSVYFLTYNLDGGDGKDTWPWTSPTERFRFDCSKLDQWEIVFSHMDRLGIHLHVITQETENDQGLDRGALGPQRKLYYRELIARFAHHPAVTWNLGEENTNTDAQRKAFCAYVRGLDPYDHPIVVHTFPGRYDQVYGPLLDCKAFDGPSLQMGNMTQTHRETVKWVVRSAKAGRRWFVCLDEIGPANTGVKPDRDDPAHDGVRHHALWGNLMAGGAGCEWYFGYRYAHNDLNCEDWRSRDAMWDQTRHAVEFFHEHLPFWAMRTADALTPADDDYCFALEGKVYAIYLPRGGATALKLPAGEFDVRWYNPRRGGALIEGRVKQVRGPGSVRLGSPPADEGKDWVVLVKRPGRLDVGPDAAPPSFDDVDVGRLARPSRPRQPGKAGPTAVTAFVLINAETDRPVAGFKTLADGATIDLAKLPTRKLNVLARTTGPVASVRFALDGRANVRTEGTAPYALGGDRDGDFDAWTPKAGTHKLTATPFDGAGGRGKALTITFRVVDKAE